MRMVRGACFNFNGKVIWSPALPLFYLIMKQLEISFNKNKIEKEPKKLTFKEILDGIDKLHEDIKDWFKNPNKPNKYKR